MRVRRALGAAQRSRLLPRQNRVDGVKAETAAVQSAQLVLHAPCPEVTLTPQRQNPGFLLGEDLLLRTALGPSALRNEPRLTLLLIAAQPLAQGRWRDPATPAGQPNIPCLLVKPH